jgi:hypothetical protein
MPDDSLIDTAVTSPGTQPSEPLVTEESMKRLRTLYKLGDDLMAQLGHEQPIDFAAIEPNLRILTTGQAFLLEMLLETINQGLSRRIEWS